MSSGARGAFSLAVAAFAWMTLLAGPARASGKASPSQVLLKADARLGSQMVSFDRYGQRQRAETPGEDKTLSPYFYVAGGDPRTERLPLKATTAEVQIAGVIAKVKVHQVFENNGAKPIEAIYVFPASTRAAVHGMRLKIGQRTVEAKIEKKQEARARYEQAKQEGKRASLLEQERPNVFTMNVANIVPKDRIEVELDYSELLVPEDAVYEFVYPTVVGPRYGGGADPKADKWVQNPYLHEGEAEPYKFDIKVHLETGIPLKELSSPSHKVDVAYESKASADVKLAQAGGGNKDFVLRYRLAGDQIESGLLLWQGEKESFFLMMMEPPARPTEAQIPAREYIFLLDVSGSMHGFPLETAKELMRNLLGQLRPTDFFNVATFSGAAQVLNPEGSLPATSANIAMATGAIARLTGGGGTELMGGLQMAYGIPKRNPNVSRSVVLVTDGYVAVEAQAFKFVREHLNEANLFSFGIGSSVNRGLIEGVARAGLGEPFVVLRPEKAKEQAERLKEYIEKPVLANISVQFQGFRAEEVAPAKLPDLLARRPIVLFGKYKGEAAGSIEIVGYSGGGRLARTLEVGAKALKPANAPIRWLWARKWVSILEDEMHLGAAQEIEEAITDLGLSYNLLTPFTSFVAVDSQVVNQGGQGEAVRQPLPMPEGVSDLAVGGGRAEAKAVHAFSGPTGGAPAGGAAYAPKRSAPVPAEPAAELKAAPAPPPMPMNVTAPARRSWATAKDEKPLVSPNPTLFIVDVQAKSLGDLKPLIQAIEAKLASAQCAKAGATLKLRLTLDKAGKVVTVEVLSETGGIAECVKKALQGLSSATRPSGGLGTLEISLKA
jgi:Ca-activated chloride channel family protein